MATNSETKKVGKLKLEGAKIKIRNFSGKPDKYNSKGGKRYFFVVIEDLDLAERLRDDGWNVKFKEREEGEVEARLQVKVNFDFKPPKVYIVTDGKRNKEPLSEDAIGTLDWADIENVDLVINPSPYNVNDKKGISAYLDYMYVNVIKDEFADKYDFDDDDEEDLPFV